MKKIFAIILTTFLMTGIFCTTAFAADTVLRVGGEKSDGTIVVVSNHSNFAEGWEAAVDLARNKKEMNNKGFLRVVVDFYADWNANSIGEFGDSDDDGFQYSTLYVPQNSRILLNLNGHTINRGLKEWEYDGEVMYIDNHANIVINNGTITGGWSCNGAGGIHINDNANVVLNNVNIVGNNVEDDDGTGIAVYDGATLTMNGGCVSNNTSYSTFPAVYGGGVYIEDSSAFFTDVTFQNNQSVEFPTHGAAVYVDDGTVVMDKCKVIDNGRQIKNNGIQYTGAYTIIDISNGSHVSLKDTDFLTNGYAQEAYTGINTQLHTAVIKVTASDLTMEKCTFTGNNQVYLMQSEAAMLTILDSDFTGNDSFAFYGYCANISNNTFTNCRFSYNKPMLDLNDTFYFSVGQTHLKFIDCDFEESTFNDHSRATFIDSDGNTKSPVGSIFGEGSLPMIFSLLAIITSIASICISVTLNKKKEVPTTASKMAEDE